MGKRKGKILNLRHGNVQVLSTLFALLLLLTFAFSGLGCSEDPAKLMATGHIYYAKGQYDEALKWFRKAMEQDHDYAYFRIGFMYEKGQGVERDVQKAVKLYKKAAEKNFFIAESQLGELYERGEGIAQDFKKAHYWYSRAAGHGSMIDKYRLGRMYELGRGVEKNLDIAFDWYLKAAAGGYAKAKEAVRCLSTGGPVGSSSPPSSTVVTDNEKKTTPEDIKIPDDLGEL